MKHQNLIALVALVWTSVISLGQATTTGSTNAPVLDQEARELKPLDTLRFNIVEDPPGRGVFPPVQITELGDAQFVISAGSQEYVKVKAAGRKLADLRKEIKEKLDAEFYQNATVNLELMKTRESEERSKVNPGSSGKVVVHGSISAQIPMRDGEKLMLSDVFASLSSQSQYANLKKVELQRIDPVTKKTQTIIKDVKRMLEKGDLKDDIELKDGDRIHVVDKGIIF